MTPENHLETPIRADAADLPAAPAFLETEELRRLWINTMRQLRGRPNPDLAGITRAFKYFKNPDGLRSVLRAVWKLEV